MMFLVLFLQIIMNFIHPLPAAAASPYHETPALDPQLQMAEAPGSARPLEPLELRVPGRNRVPGDLQLARLQAASRRCIYRGVRQVAVLQRRSIRRSHP